jgi:hypothetical protein
VREKKGMKGLMLLLMLLVTLSQVLKHACKDSPLPFSAPHMPMSLNPLPLPAQLLSFSPDDDGIRRRKKKIKEKRKALEDCNRDCHEKFYRMRGLVGLVQAYMELEFCCELCELIVGLL